MRRYGSTFRIMAFLAGFSAFLELAAFQADWRATAKNLKNRYEGTIRINRNSEPEFDLVSLASIDGYPMDRGVSLRVRFYLPAGAQASSLQAFVQAFDLDGQVQYRMESKPSAWERKQWNAFTDWDTNEVLVPVKLPATNLGVLVRLGGASSDHRQFSPAVVSQSESAKADSYRFSIHVGPDRVRDLKWELYRVDRTPKGDALLPAQQSGMLARSIRDDHAEDKIMTAPLNEGWYQVRLNGTYESLPGSAGYDFEFYRGPAN
jgi:hypothetical protein